MSDKITLSFKMDFGATCNASFTKEMRLYKSTIDNCETFDVLDSG